MSSSFEGRVSFRVLFNLGRRFECCHYIVLIPLTVGTVHIVNNIQVVRNAHHLNIVDNVYSMHMVHNLHYACAGCTKLCNGTKTWNVQLSIAMLYIANGG